MIHSYHARRAFTAVAIMAAAGAGLAACGSTGPSYGGAGSGTTPSSNPTTPGSVSLVSTSAGNVLTDGTGRTLYLLTSDSQGQSNCSGSCLASWPASAATAAHGKGVTATLGSLTRSDGTKQLTVDGMPAYTYAADSAAGDVNGQGIVSFGGTWWVLAADGSPITTIPHMSTTPMSRY